MLLFIEFDLRAEHKFGSVEMPFNFLVTINSLSLSLVETHS